MNKSLLHIEIQEYINANLQIDSSKVAFKGSPFLSVSTQELLQQIEGKKRTEKKLPSWYNTSNIYYPPKINLEQTSSEITARYKANLVACKSIADITGGFGVDTFYFSKQCDAVDYYEINESLFEIVSYNFKQLNSTNITCFKGSSLSIIKQKEYDVIYVDPSRRSDLKGKVFMLSDCIPNVVEHLSFLFKHCETILIKTSPMLDISMGVRELKNIKSVHIVAVNNEVKELLWFLTLKEFSEIKIHAVNITNSKTDCFESVFNTTEEPLYSEPLAYLYEPNAALMKSGLFGDISIQFKIFKLHKHSHLYTSNDIKDFFGRRFKIIQCVPYSKNTLKKLNIIKANITTRNFPLKVAEIKRKFKIIDGGKDYLFFTTILKDKKVVIHCRKI